MPIHLLWGDDSARTEREISKLIQQIIDPAWSTINLSRLDGASNDQALQALEEVRTPPLGNGGRLVLLKHNPFCNGCSNELARVFENSLKLIPENSHLVLLNANKPDGRLKTTKSIQKLIKANEAYEKSFLLPAVWDGSGQKKLVEDTAKELGMILEGKTATMLVEAIGNDSSRLNCELSKLALLATKKGISKTNQLLISEEMVGSLIQGVSTNAFQIGDSLVIGNIGEAIKLIDALIDNGEPPLRILATLTGQARGWLWVSLLDNQGEKDVSVIAKAAGIANPKRIYIMRKQIEGIMPMRFQNLLSCLLDVEEAIKKGVSPSDAFKEGLLKTNP